MKKTIFLIIALIITLQGFAQVNYENTYFLAPDEEFFLTNLGNNDYKYVIYDYDSSKFSLYNLDNTPFLLNVMIPFNVVNPATNTYYRLGYISYSLFDCDSTNIEYAIMLSTPRVNEHPNFAVYRTDGTLIFSKDSVGTMFCIGCGSGSYEVHPIMNTPLGTKLYLFNYDSVGYYARIIIYGLCGTLTESINEISQTDTYVKVFPNPGSDNVNFEITSPSSYQEYELTIFNSAFQTVTSKKINGIKTKIDVDRNHLESGVYFYSLSGKNKVFQTGKFIIAK